MMECGQAEQILNRPKHPYTKALVAAMPEFGSHYTTEKMNFIEGKVSDPSNPPDGCPFAPRCGNASEKCRSIEEGCVEVL